MDEKQFTAEVLRAIELIQERQDKIEEAISNILEFKNQAIATFEKAGHPINSSRRNHGQ